MNPLAVTEGVLRPRSTARQDVARRDVFVVLVLAALLHGAVVGSQGLRPLQMLYSGLKLPLLLLTSSLICLPNFFMVNTLLGLRRDFPVVLRGLLTAQATVAVSLLGLAPLVAVVYASTADYPLAVCVNGVAFLVASLAGQVTLARVYRPLVRRRPRHRVGRASWLVLYVFVTIQLAWMLRPFIGAPDLATTFFRPGAWDNAYLAVWEDVVRVLGGPH